MKTRFYKTMIATAFLFSGLTSLSMNAGTRDSLKLEECLEVIGIAIDEKNEAVDGVEVKLFKENEELEWVEVTTVSYHDHNFAFRLETNQYYTIEVTKAGYITRSVVISTELPKNVDLRIIFKYGFEVVLFKEKKWKDDFYLDFPVALISYNKKSEVFENSNNYTRHIKEKLKESEK